MRTAIVTLLMLGCSSPANRPSCPEAMKRFYLAGCQYINVDVSPSRPYTEPEAEAFCELTATAAERFCTGRELDDWLACMVDVPADSSCCNATYTAVFNCAQ